ncbi:DUF4365 domain-containing protein [Flavobacterium sp. UBA4854]|uniref:DUF4365 domain-containing protein n=1 Tax=Flavobacterium sp. UBA4854 TaxID=1946548 RepID=UPI00257F426A|nr:DUF4365 domain-containing protein [Flavobacterium sp. UBA4854]
MIDYPLALSNNYIEKTANDTILGTLRDLFVRKNLDLGENKTDSSQDWGTDFYIEVINKDVKRELLFLIQCKGTNGNVTIKNDDTFSFQMSIRHANYYYYELSEPLIFFVCDIRTKIVYWYPVQTDHSLEDRIKEQVKSGKESLQVYIPASNTLCLENFERFLADLENSRRTQIHKNKIKINTTANYDEIYKIGNELNIIDAFDKILDSYQGINVFPTFIINKILSFIGRGTSLYGENLTTNNESLYDLFQNLSLKKNQISLQKKGELYKNVEDIQKKLHRILDFFELNLITHIEWRGTGNKEARRLCVHDLFLSGNCQCERCTYKKLNLLKTEKLLNTPLPNANAESRLKKAYAHFLMNDYEQSYSQYSSLLKEIKITDNPGIYIVAKYNLLQLKNHFNNTYTPNSAEILKELENQNFILDEILIPGYLHDVLTLIKENRLVPNSVLAVDNTLTDIRNMWTNDQLGGSSSNSFDRILVIDFLRAYNFIEFNLLIYNEYKEFETLVNKTMEGIFALYSIKNSSSSKYEHFEYTIIDMWLFHAEPKYVHRLIKKYRLKSVKLESAETVCDQLSLYIDNLLLSAELIRQRFDEKNHSHNRKIARIVENYLLIISMIEIDEESRNILLNKYLTLAEKLNHWYFTALEYLIFFLDNIQMISAENLKKIIQIMITHERYNSDTFGLAVARYCEKFPNGETLENELKILFSTDKFNADDFCKNNKFSALVSIIPKLTRRTQNRIKKGILNKLHKNFSTSIYYSYTVYDIIDFDGALLQKYIDRTPDYTQEPYSRNFLGTRKELRNYHLDRLISLIFKFDLEFTAEIRSLSCRAADRDYYDWLMNMETYNYDNFNIYWVLYNKTTYYLKAFRKCKKLQAQLAAGLKENYIEGVAKVYLAITS